MQLNTKRKYTREQTIEWLLNNTHVMHNGCWELNDDFWWFFSDSGYPRIRWDGRSINMCRLILFEDLSTDMVTRHRCHNKSCVRPDHLIEGTSSENQRDNYYAPFEMPDHYEQNGAEWWDGPSDEKKEREYERYLRESESESERESESESESESEI